MIDQQGPTAASAALPQPSLVLDEIALANLVTQHRSLRRMCDELEAFADCVLDRHVIERAALLSAEFAAALRDHDVGDHALLHILVAGNLAQGTGSLGERIRCCHAIDFLHAEDLRDALQIEAASNAPIRADLLGYMMRCLFDGCRRGIDFQEAAILVVAHDRMSETARAQLGASLRGA